MEYVSIIKEIQNTFTNVKYWSLMIQKRHCDEIAGCLKCSLARLKKLISVLLATAPNADERTTVSTINQEIERIEKDL